MSIEDATAQMGTATAAMNRLTAAVDVKKATLDASVADAEAARDASQAARDTTLGYRNEAEVHKTDAAQSATVATAAAAALVGTEGIIPTASEVLWLASKPQAGVNALGFFDTGARLLSGVSERALLRYGEDNDTLNFMLLDGGVDGVRLDFTAEGALFADASGFTPATPGSSVGLALDQSEGLALGADQITNGGFDTDLTGWYVGANISAIQDAGEAEVTFNGPITTAVNWFSGGPLVPNGDKRFFEIEFDATWVSGPGSLQVGIGYISQATVPLNSGKTRYTVKAASMRGFASGSGIFPGFTFGITGTTTTVWRLDNVRVREIAGTHAAQPNAALQGKFGKAPKVVRNRLLYTEDLTGPSWTRAGLLTPTDNGDGVFSIVEDTSNSAHNISSARTKSEDAAGAALEVKNLSGSRRVRFLLYRTDSPFTSLGSVDVNPATGEVTAGAGTVTALPDGWFRVFVSGSNSGFNNVRWQLNLIDGTAASYLGDGTSGVLVRKPSLSSGLIDVPYQAVGASDLDVTESGVEGFGFYRPDLSDDVLPLTVPAIDGDILIAGKKGTWIEPAAPSAGAFSIGPTTYTGGTPGILRAVGDLCGVELIDKTLSAEERARVIAYYTARGAKGLLVPGPELVTNGGFDTDVSGWTQTGSNASNFWEWSGGAARCVSAGTYVALSQSILTAGRLYVLALDVTVAVGGIKIASINTGLQDDIAVNINATGAYSFIFSALSDILYFGRFPGTADATIDNVSMRELRPEEDW